MSHGFWGSLQAQILVAINTATAAKFPVPTQLDQALGKVATVYQDWALGRTLLHAGIGPQGGGCHAPGWPPGHSRLVCQIRPMDQTGTWCGCHSPHPGRHMPLATSWGYSTPHAQAVTWENSPAALDQIRTKLGITWKG